MTTAAVASAAPDGLGFICLDPPVPPPWVADVLGPEAKDQPVVAPEGVRVRLEEGRDVSFLRVAVPGAGRLHDPAFLAAAEHAYASIGAILRARDEFPWRLWNYVPGIRTRAPGASSRYEIFNAGRAAGYADWCVAGAPGSLPFAPASGIDHRGDDLWVHVLAGRRPATPVENPRQIPAYRYSRRYGAVSPRFSRAVLIEPPASPWNELRMALVSGTASIAGEDSQHPNDLDAQLRETLLNLASLSATLAGERPRPDAGLDADARRALSRYREVRGYVVREEDAASVLAGLRRALPNLHRLELASAELCRPELLVEVEGVLSPDA